MAAAGGSAGVFFSSLVALTGMPGQTDYAAANAAMDALAQSLHAQGRRAKSLDWGPWSVGMASDPRYQRIYRRMRLHPFSVVTGVRAFFEALSYDGVQLAVVDVDAAHESELLRGFNKAPLTAVTSTAPVGRDRIPVPALTQRVTSLIAQHLRCSVEVLETSTAFQDLGMDSLMAVEIALAIQDYMGIRLQPTLLLELQSMTELMAHLEALMNEEGHP